MEKYKEKILTYFESLKNTTGITIAKYYVARKIELEIRTHIDTLLSQRTSECVAISGKSGCGKSWILWQIAKEYIKKEGVNASYVNAEDIQGGIHEEQKKSSIIKTAIEQKLSIKFFPQEYKNKILFIDGIDRLFSENNTTHLREELCKLTNQGWTIVTTAREQTTFSEHGYGDKHFFIDDFSGEELDKALETYLLLNSYSQKQVTNIKEKLLNNPAFQQICSNPLRLRMFIESHNPSDPPYNLTVRNLFSKFWDAKIETTKRDDTFLTKQKKLIVFYVAIQALEKGKLKITHEERDNIKQDFPSAYQELVSEGILVTTGDELFHQAFCEYAAAKALTYFEQVDSAKEIENLTRCAVKTFDSFKIAVHTQTILLLEKDKQEEVVTDLLGRKQPFLTSLAAPIYSSIENPTTKLQRHIHSAIKTDISAKLFYLENVSNLSKNRIDQEFPRIIQQILKEDDEIFLKTKAINAVAAILPFLADNQLEEIYPTLLENGRYFFAISEKESSPFKIIKQVVLNDFNRGIEILRQTLTFSYARNQADFFKKLMQQFPSSDTRSRIYKALLNQNIVFREILANVITIIANTNQELVEEIVIQLSRDRIKIRQILESNLRIISDKLSKETREAVTKDLHVKLYPTAYYDLKATSDNILSLSKDENKQIRKTIASCLDEVLKDFPDKFQKVYAVLVHDENPDVQQKAIKSFLKLPFNISKELKAETYPIIEKVIAEYENYYNTFETINRNSKKLFQIFPEKCPELINLIIKKRHVDLNLSVAENLSDIIHNCPQERKKDLSQSIEKFIVAAPRMQTSIGKTLSPWFIEGIADNTEQIIRHFPSLIPNLLEMAKDSTFIALKLHAEHLLNEIAQNYEERDKQRITDTLRAALQGDNLMKETAASLLQKICPQKEVPKIIQQYQDDPAILSILVKNSKGNQAFKSKTGKTLKDEIQKLKIEIKKSFTIEDKKGKSIEYKKNKMEVYFDFSKKKEFFVTQNGKITKRGRIRDSNRAFRLAEEMLNNKNTVHWTIGYVVSPEWREKGTKKPNIKFWRTSADPGKAIIPELVKGKEQRTGIYIFNPDIAIISSIEDANNLYKRIKINDGTPTEVISKLKMVLEKYPESTKVWKTIIDIVQKNPDQKSHIDGLEFSAQEVFSNRERVLRGAIERIQMEADKEQWKGIWEKAEIYLVKLSIELREVRQCKHILTKWCENATPGSEEAQCAILIELMNEIREYQSDFEDARKNLKFFALLTSPIIESVVSSERDSIVAEEQKKKGSVPEGLLTKRQLIEYRKPDPQGIENKLKTLLFLIVREEKSRIKYEGVNAFKKFLREKLKYKYKKEAWRDDKEDLPGDDTVDWLRKMREEQESQSKDK